MRILVIGAQGQLGWELVRSCQVHGEVIAATRAQVDLSRPDDAAASVVRYRPDVILNAAAYTAVDRAEDEEDAAHRVNAESVGAIAKAACGLNALLVHYSTDYVFDGRKDAPYVESDVPMPLSAYGRSKLGGERALAASGADYLCFRTSWVYASRGSNFLRTMLRLSTTHRKLRVVADNCGAPTSARFIADATTVALRHAASERHDGTFKSELLHLTASGVTSSYGFADAIFRIRKSLCADGFDAPILLPILGTEYVTCAMRPANSQLACHHFSTRFGTPLPAWEEGVRLILEELADVREF